MGGVQFKRPKRAAIILALSVIALICLLRRLNPVFLDEIECRTYDWRVQFARKESGLTATNLAFVAMEDSSIKADPARAAWPALWPVLATAHLRTAWSRNFRRSCAECISLRYIVWRIAAGTTLRS